MIDPEAEKVAAQTAYQANSDVSDFILAQAGERLRALQTAAHALDQRVTAVAAFQFAGAALAGATAGPSLAAITALSGVLFVVGGITAFRGIRSDPIQLPGIAPAWWGEAPRAPSYQLDEAKGWAAGVYQNAIDQIDHENCERAKHLNVSLWYAVAAAVLAGTAASLRAFT